MPDGAVWNLLWEHRDRLIRLARKKGLRRDAEDIAHDAIIRCATYPALDPARAGALLTATTTRLCIDHARRRRAEIKMWASQQDVEGDDHDVVLSRAEAAWLESTVRLTEIEAAALAARVAGEVPREFAPRLGVSVKSAEAALTRARRKMLSAWKATLGVIGALRLRRSLLAPTAAATVVAVALAVAYTLPRFAEHIVPVSEEPTGTPMASSTTLPPPHPREAASSPPTPSVPPRPSAPERPTPPRIAVVPTTSVGPVQQDGIAVVLDEEPPQERLRKCLDHGVEVTVTPSRIEVVCGRGREGDGA